MPFLDDAALDNGLAYLTTNGSRIDICSQEPANYTEATSTYTLGNKTGLAVGAAQNGDVSGRKVVVPAITDGAVTASGMASHWALSKTTVTTALLSASTLAATQVVTNGNTFTLAATDITIPDPA